MNKLHLIIIFIVTLTLSACEEQAKTVVIKEQQNPVIISKINFFLNDSAKTYKKLEIVNPLVSDLVKSGFQERESMKFLMDSSIHRIELIKFEETEGSRRFESGMAMFVLILIFLCLVTW